MAPEEAARRLAENGDNTNVQARKRGPVPIFAAQFLSVIIWVLMLAGALSGLLGQFVDAITILAVVLLHACLGIYQKFSAANAAAALQLPTSPKANVSRQGKASSV